MTRENPAGALGLVNKVGADGREAEAAWTSAPAPQVVYPPPPLAWSTQFPPEKHKTSLKRTALFLFSKHFDGLPLHLG